MSGPEARGRRICGPGSGVYPGDWMSAHIGGVWQSESAQRLSGARLGGDADGRAGAAV